MCGKAEVRLRENVKEVETVNDDGSTNVLYEYDEYVFVIDDTASAVADIMSNFDAWVTTGKLLEITSGASLIKDMEEALSILGVDVYAG